MTQERLSAFILADTEKCTGCRTCEIACALVHLGAESPKVAGAIKTRLNPRIYAVIAEDTSAVVVCRHCEDASCMNVCRASAIHRVEGRVEVDPQRCIGCRLCLMACPFGAIEFVCEDAATKKPADNDAGKTTWHASKCDLCKGRAAGPACVGQCPEQALAQVDASTAIKDRKLEALRQMSMQNAASTGLEDDELLNAVTIIKDRRDEAALAFLNKQNDQRDISRG